MPELVITRMGDTPMEQGNRSPPKKERKEQNLPKASLLSSLSACEGYDSGGRSAGSP